MSNRYTKDIDFGSDDDSSGDESPAVVASDKKQSKHNDKKTSPTTDNNEGAPRPKTPEVKPKDGQPVDTPLRLKSDVKKNRAATPGTKPGMTPQSAKALNNVNKSIVDGLIGQVKPQQELLLNSTGLLLQAIADQNRITLDLKKVNPMKPLKTDATSASDAIIDDNATDRSGDGDNADSGDDDDADAVNVDDEGGDDNDEEMAQDGDADADADEDETEAEEDDSVKIPSDDEEDEDFDPDSGLVEGGDDDEATDVALVPTNETLDDVAEDIRFTDEQYITYAERMMNMSRYHLTTDFKSDSVAGLMAAIVHGCRAMEEKEGKPANRVKIHILLLEIFDILVTSNGGNRMNSFITAYNTPPRDAAGLRDVQRMKQAADRWEDTPVIRRIISLSEDIFFNEAANLTPVQKNKLIMIRRLELLTTINRLHSLIDEGNLELRNNLLNHKGPNIFVPVSGKSKARTAVMKFLCAEMGLEQAVFDQEIAKMRAVMAFCRDDAFGKGFILLMRPTSLGVFHEAGAPYCQAAAEALVATLGEGRIRPLRDAITQHVYLPFIRGQPIRMYVPKAHPGSTSSYAWKRITDCVNMANKTLAVAKPKSNTVQKNTKAGAKATTQQKGTSKANDKKRSANGNDDKPPKKKVKKTLTATKPSDATGGN